MSDGKLYAARYFDHLSPTWFQWNKLTAHDLLHHVHSVPDFAGRDVWFWLNHPLQFFQIMGLVVQIDSVADGRYTFLTIDDGSGVNMEAKIERRPAWRDEEPEWKENSQVEDVDVFVNLGLPVVLLHGKQVEVGEVMLVKGTLTTFRHEKQLVVKRMRRMKDTNEEVVWWGRMADWKRTVLSTPWVITEAEKASVDQRLKREGHESNKVVKRDSRRAERRREWEERHSAKEEIKRSLQEEKMNRHALEGSHILHIPWD
ncbi:uncharacterized protein RCC_10694 [Ramularia collo-cygni]|uniref:CST complex subunit STN1 n=1 Tax=Ramularia collo-cygni TaxID=112498 RepID=A0A2D3VG81_9PEZI|nr:uncharacterized protein RCC_10694 [Ramularia collo-cygni]CZT24965.1 uncharacterized protein RCC_10694 [Ramularia collo-cygni]